MAPASINRGHRAGAVKAYPSTSNTIERRWLLHRQIGSVVGEANCIIGLGNICGKDSDLVAARGCYLKALAYIGLFPILITSVSRTNGSH